MYMKSFGDLLAIYSDILVFFFTYLAAVCSNLASQLAICIHADLYLSSLQSFFDRGLSELEYKNTMRVDLPEVDFSFHEDNSKVKETTAPGFPCSPSFPLTSFIIFLLISLGGWQLSINDASWSRDVNSVISLTLWLSSWKEKSTSGKPTLMVFLQ